ncbi:MAG: response regulator [Phycisphaerales bacterium]|nr:response regulator [Phycisphaerales bacterium]
MKDRISVRALIIDDDASLCQKLSGWLAEECFEVTTSTDPSDGLRKATATAFDLALVDLIMPQVDGTDVIQNLCQASPRTRVVAMSAFTDSDQFVRARRAGARAVLPKPIQQPILLQEIDRQLSELGLGVRTEEEFNLRLGSRIREIRQATGRTLQDVASLAEITAAQLSQIELGKTATSTWTLARISGVLNVSLSSLFAGFQGDRRPAPPPS